MKMKGALIVALAVAIGSFLQGWVTALLIVGYTPTKEFKKMEFKLDETAKWLVTNTVTIGVMLAHRLGKAGKLRFRSFLVIWSILRLFCSTVMPFSSVFYLIDGIGVSLSMIHIPAYYKETGRPRELHSSLPIYAFICGFVLCLKVCGLPPETFPGWRFALEVSFILSLMYSAMVVFFLPESPVWLVIDGRNVEARQVLQFLHGSEDVSDEMDWVLQNVKVAGYNKSADKNNDKKPAGEQKHGTPVGVLSDVEREDMQMTSSASSGCVNSAIPNRSVGDPFLIVSGDGSVHEESLTTEEEDCTCNAEEASKLTIGHRHTDDDGQAMPQ